VLTVTELTRSVNSGEVVTVTEKVNSKTSPVETCLTSILVVSKLKKVGLVNGGTMVPCVRTSNSPLGLAEMDRGGLTPGLN